MDVMVRRLIRISVTFRNLAFSQVQRVNINIPKFCHSSSQLQKNKVKNHSDIKGPTEDLMLKTLQQGLSPSKLLNYIDSNKHQIRREHVLAALSSLHNFYQDQQQSTESLHEQVDFTKLCTCLKPLIKQLSPTEVIEALNVLELLNVPCSNVFITTLLQHIEESTEKLSLQEVYKLFLLFDKYSYSNVNESIVSKIKNCFFEELSQLVNKRDTIQLNDAVHILMTLCLIQEPTDKFKNIIQFVQQVIIQNNDKLENEQIIQIIQGISSKIKSKHEEFYNETFIDEIVTKLIHENWEFLQGNEILSCLNSIRHVQIDLLDYLSAKCYESPEILELNSDLLQPLVMGLALADYKPVFWDVMKDSILNNEISKTDHLKLCKFALNLACLECFEPIPLAEIFSTKNVISEEHRETLLRLYQIVKTLYPSYKGPWPSKDLLNSFKTLQLNRRQDYPLSQALEQAVGGNAYVKTNIRTMWEHYIDHVVIINRSGYPIAINSYGTIDEKCYNNNVTYLEDLSIPPGSQIFLILYAHPEWYTRNTQRMLGPYSLFIKTLESISYTVIPVNGNMWEKMPENEKTLYIMQAIKLKFENDSISTTS